MQVIDHKIWSERYRLAALSQTELIKIGLVAVVLALIYVVFHFQGNTTETDKLSRSAFLWLQFRWNTSGGDFSHGWLIPLVSGGIIWWKRKELAQATKNISYLGLAVLVGGLLMHYVGAKAQQPRLSVMGFITVLWGIPFYLYGWKTAKLLSFPAGFLIFCIPLNFLDAMTFPLRMMVTAMTEHTLNGLGIEVARSGSVIKAMNGTFQFNIDDPCSGLRSLIALSAITAVYAYTTQKTFLKKWALFACSIPIAVAGNFFRILTIGLMAQAFGQRIATGIYHDYSGYIFFPVAIGLMLMCGWILSQDYGLLWKKFRTYLEKERELHSAPIGGRTSEGL